MPHLVCHAREASSASATAVALTKGKPFLKNRTTHESEGENQSSQFVCDPSLTVQKEYGTSVYYLNAILAVCGRKASSATAATAALKKEEFVLKNRTTTN